MRDRLINLIAKGKRTMWGKTFHGRKEQLEYLADYLLENGVIVPPCKVGDTVYYLNCRYEKNGRKKVLIGFIDKGKVDNITIGEKGVPQIEVSNEENKWIMFDCIDDFGRFVFLTREEAERALEVGEKV